MIIGSGFLAKAFFSRFGNSPEICVYASGVSDSASTDPEAFGREKRLLAGSLAANRSARAFLYFSTCGVYDEASRDSAYVRHKLEMEAAVSGHPGHLIVRLPQTAGRTSNPHTLLNYLYAKITGGERFQLWKNATRNIIDIDDIVPIVSRMAEDPAFAASTVNVANPRSVTMPELVAMMEKAAGRKALADPVEKGAPYAIDISRIRPVIEELGLAFGEAYLPRVLEKYFGAGKK